MKVILVGYPGSQFIIPLCAYLTSKYLPNFDIIYLNHKDSNDKWSFFIANFLETITDEKVIFALDDYLLNGANLEELNIAINEGPCVKLCETTEQEHLEYPCTTQYTVWDRKLLISILKQTTSPWDFEIKGSKLLPIKPTIRTCIYYDVHSSLSSRWEGINFNSVKAEDIWKHLKSI